MAHNIEELFNSLTTWEAAFTENGYINEEDRVTIKEAFGTPDAPFLFPKVISRTLREAAEPAALVTPLLDTVRVTSRSIEIPAINAIQAAEIAEGQEYPEQQLQIDGQVEGKISKKGVKVVFTEEVINDSQWDIVALHVRAAARAMTRLREQIALVRFKNAASVVFDNNGGEATTGVGDDGNANSTASWSDYLTMASILHAENKFPTDLIMHPLMWPAFLHGPQFNSAYAPAAGWNQSVTSKQGVLNQTAPFGLNVILSPFVSFTAAVGDDPAVSDIFMIDRNDVGAMLVREDMSMDTWDDQTRDLRAMKFKERYDIVAYGDGEGIVVAKDVALDKSYSIQLTKDVG